MFFLNFLSYIRKLRSHKSTAYRNTHHVLFKQNRKNHLPFRRRLNTENIKKKCLICNFKKKLQLKSKYWKK